MAEVRERLFFAPPNGHWTVAMWTRHTRPELHAQRCKLTRITAPLVRAPYSLRNVRDRCGVSQGR